MKRPQQLWLSPSEGYGTTVRKSEAPPCEKFVCSDMQHLAHFVYTFYQEKVKAMHMVYKVSALTVFSS